MHSEVIVAQPINEPVVKIVDGGDRFRMGTPKGAFTATTKNLQRSAPVHRHRQIFLS
jgi:hypothetical protein